MMYYYATKKGTTEKAILTIIKGYTEASKEEPECINLKETKNLTNKIDDLFVVLGTPIYFDAPLKEFSDFITYNREQLREKNVFVVFVGGNKKILDKHCFDNGYVFLEGKTLEECKDKMVKNSKCSEDLIDNFKIIYIPGIIDPSKLSQFETFCNKGFASKEEVEKYYSGLTKIKIIGERLYQIEVNNLKNLDSAE